MRWRKLGHVFTPDGREAWMTSHAANPVVELIDEHQVRFYFSSRDTENRSCISFIEVDLREPHRVLRHASKPVLLPGELAMFDDSGASIGCIVPVGKRRYLYYMGWHLTVRVPWQNALGLAISDGPGKPFVRASRFPIVPLDEIDPYTISYPWVIREGDLFRMWYGSNVAWGPRKEDMRHLIKYAESNDGIHWSRSGHVAIDFESPNEYAMCKPCVLKRNGIYQMWFCSRGDAYRIRYAESRDGLEWTRLPEPGGIDVSPESGEWDSEMIEYPCVFEHRLGLYMAYCGNGFGRTGFGLAIAEDR